MIWRALLIVLLPVQVSALSCLPYGVTDAFRDAVQAKSNYVVVEGDLAFDPDRLPRADANVNAPPLTRIPASITGQMIGPNGQSRTFSEKVLLEVRCFGPWCPAPRTGDTLAFLKKKGRRYILETDACGGFLFRLGDDMIQIVRDCLDGRACEPSEEFR